MVRLWAVRLTMYIEPDKVVSVETGDRDCSLVSESRRIVFLVVEEFQKVLAVTAQGKSSF